jgi:hypothetical protein
MPFTDSPSKLAPIPTRTERAIAAVLADAGSHDQRQHRDRALKRACPVCPAVINERCHAESYPSGRPRSFAAEPHAERAALARGEQ